MISVYTLKVPSSSVIPPESSAPSTKAGTESTVQATVISIILPLLRGLHYRYE